MLYVGFSQEHKELTHSYKTVLSRPYIRHYLLQIVGGPLPDSKRSENQSQRVVLWMCLVAKEGRDLPLFVWPC